MRSDRKLAAFSLVEVLVVIAVAGVSIIAVAGVQVRSLIALADNEVIDAANNTAVKAIDAARSAAGVVIVSGGQPASTNITRSKYSVSFDAAGSAVLARQLDSDVDLATYTDFSCTPTSAYAVTIANAASTVTKPLCVQVLLDKLTDELGNEVFEFKTNTAYTTSFGNIVNQYKNYRRGPIVVKAGDVETVIQPVNK